jgi:hypothetical protein
MHFRRALLLPAFALLQAGVLPAVQAAPPCSLSVPVNGECEISLDSLHPTQSAIGLIQVEERVARMKPGINGVAYTEKRPMPVVQGPDGNFYLTDGHHLASTLNRLHVPRVTAKVIGRFSNPAGFWREMQKRQWVYLYDAKGNPISPGALPKRIADLGDDPYRALAGYAQDAGYYGKSDVYFAEFHWARYFGANMGWQPVDRLNLLYALQAAEKLACQPAAKNLPGYAGPCRAPDGMK